MEIVFTKDYLIDVYKGDLKKLKAFKSNPQLVKQYVKTINKLKSITRIEQLHQINSLRYAKKGGDLKGISAVRINKQYRLLFREIASDTNTMVIDVLEIDDISKHYE